MWVFIVNSNPPLCTLLLPHLDTSMTELYTAMKRYYSKSVSPATWKSYKAGTRQYVQFCQRSSLPCVPTSEKTLLLFATHLAIRGLSYATIKVYLAAVRYLHTTAGHHNTYDSHFTPRIQHLLKGIHKESARLRPPKNRLPVTIKIMKRIKKFLSKQAETYQSKLLWAACCIAFFGILRVSEFTVPSQYGYDQDYHLSLTDVTLDNRRSPTVIQLHIKQSKMDRFIHFSLQKPQRYMPSSCHCTVPYHARVTERAIVPLARWHNAHQAYFCFSTSKNYPQP